LVQLGIGLEKVYRIEGWLAGTGLIQLWEVKLKKALVKTFGGYYSGFLIF